MDDQKEELIDSGDYEWDQRCTEPHAKMKGVNPIGFKIKML